jgi:5-methylcytosine-specific restriction enzyme A
VQNAEFIKSLCILHFILCTTFAGVSWRNCLRSATTNQGFENFQPITRMHTFQEEYRTDGMDEVCAFCNREVPTRGHHVVPRCKGGRDIAPTCHSCEDFIHKTWTHNELRDEYNTVEKIQSDPRFQKFLRWLYRQQEGAFFRTRRNRNRTGQPYR